MLLADQLHILRFFLNLDGDYKDFSLVLAYISLSVVCDTCISVAYTTFFP